MKKALIAMSGGVDSSVAAALMLRRGWQALGCTMRLLPGEGGRCCSLDDVEDARRAAFRLGMPYYVFNFTEDFRKQVTEPFCEAYFRGETPNPCLRCNGRLKFDRLLRRSRELGCDALVTGHYARIDREGGLWRLRKALDETKDQSYALYMLGQEQLSRLCLPLGGLRKTEVRRLAEELGLPNARKPDSQDICFVPDGDYAAAVERLAGQQSPPGDFVDTAGRVLGQHRGLIRYTVGQRRGLGVSGGERLYVLALRPKDNTVVLGTEEELLTHTVTVPVFHWIGGEAPRRPFEASARVRYRQREQEALVRPLPGGGVRLEFREPLRRPAPGQAAVVYLGDEVLGGGIIASCENGTVSDILIGERSVSAG